MGYSSPWRWMQSRHRTTGTASTVSALFIIITMFATVRYVVLHPVLNAMILPRSSSASISRIFVSSLFRRFRGIRNTLPCYACYGVLHCFLGDAIFCGKLFIRCAFVCSFPSRILYRLFGQLGKWLFFPCESDISPFLSVALIVFYIPTFASDNNQLK